MTVLHRSPPRSIVSPPRYSHAMASPALPTRTNTTVTSGSESGVIPDGDPSTTSGLLIERLQAWKHMCGYLEEYIKATSKDEHEHSRDLERVLKTVSNPLRESHHFDTALGGVAGLFENIRANTQARIAMHEETSKNLAGSVLPILERLHQELKNKIKEIEKGAGRGSKAVDAARAASQKHIELLGQQAAHFDSTGGNSRIAANHDPYVLHRGVYHRLNKQLLEENNNRQDLIAVQNSFQQFEAHVITTVQTAINSFNQFMSGQADRQKAMFGDIAATSSNVPLDFEWKGFVQRNQHVLVNPNAPARSMTNVSFPNETHRSTKPIIEGSLERKSRSMGALKGFSPGYYAVTPAGYLHEYKDNDNLHKDPSPEISLYLPDCIIGAVDGSRFTIKGKDSSSSKIGLKMAITSDFQFKAHTNSDADTWHMIISSFTSGVSGSLPTSPTESRNITPIATRLDEEQTQGVVASGPNSATSPQSARVPSGTTSATTVSPQSTGAAPAAVAATTTAPATAAATSSPPAVTSPVDVKAGSPTPNAGAFHGAPEGQPLADRKFVENK